MVLKSILNQDLEQVKPYKKIYLKIYGMLEELIKGHLELIFLQFDLALLQQIVERILIPGCNDDHYDIRTASLQSVDSINEFIFNNLRKPSKRYPKLAQNVNHFY